MCPSMNLQRPNSQTNLAKEGQTKGGMYQQETSKLSKFGSQGGITHICQGRGSICSMRTQRIHIHLDKPYYMTQQSEKQLWLFCIANIGRKIRLVELKLADSLSIFPSVCKYWHFMSCHTHNQQHYRADTEHH